MPLQKPPSNARFLYDHITGQNDPFEFLKQIPLRFATDPFFEEEWIDFKGSPQNDAEAKKIWSKALSGFANISDGVVIWGIDARETPPRDIDAACGLRLVPDPHAFESKLRAWVRDATNPPVNDVEYKSYPGPNNEGFVVCVIPESRYKPHRAEKANRQYYYRASDDFLPIEPGHLRALFYPQVAPSLWVEVFLSFKLNPAERETNYRKTPNAYEHDILANNPPTMALAVTLHNTGAATAKDVYVIVHTEELLNYHQGGDWRIGRNPRGIAFAALRPLHPGEVTEMFTASFQRTFGNSQGVADSWEIKPYFDTISLGFSMFAEGTQVQDAVVEFVPEDFSFETGYATKQGLPTS